MGWPNDQLHWLPTLHPHQVYARIPPPLLPQQYSFFFVFRITALTVSGRQYFLMCLVDIFLRLITRSIFKLTYGHLCDLCGDLSVQILDPFFPLGCSLDASISLATSFTSVSPHNVSQSLSFLMVQPVAHTQKRILFLIQLNLSMCVCCENYEVMRIYLFQVFPVELC